MPKGKRGLQIDKPTRTFAFRLSNDVSQDAKARKILEDFEAEGGNLRAAIVHWLTRDDRELLIVHQGNVELAIEDAFNRFKADFFIEVLEHLRSEHPASLRQFVETDNNPIQPAAPLTPDFINGLLNGMKKRGK